MKLRSESRKVAAFATPIAFMLPATHEITISNASSPLLRLPQELKERIYQFVCAEYGICSYQGVMTCSISARKTCRQMYHDMKNAFYSANVFAFGKPKRLGWFIRRLNHVNYSSAAVRDIHLSLCISNKNEEREWDNVLRALAEAFKHLRSIRIVVFDRIQDHHPYSINCRRSPIHRNTPYPPGLLYLKKLPLKDFELEMRTFLSDNFGAYQELLWPDDQYQEWKQSTERAILGSG